MAVPILNGDILWDQVVISFQDEVETLVVAFNLSSYIEDPGIM